MMIINSGIGDVVKWADLKDYEGDRICMINDYGMIIDD